MIADPAIFVAGDGPICIDEYQKAPVVLDAIKAVLNRDSRPGRFVLAGSTRHDSLPSAAQALTGRLSRLRVYPLAQVELERTDDNLAVDTPWRSSIPESNGRERPTKSARRAITPRRTRFEQRVGLSTCFGPSLALSFGPSWWVSVWVGGRWWLI